MIDLRKAETAEAEEILNFYRNIIDSIEGSEFKPKWNETYPDLEYIETCIKEGELYVYTQDDGLISCVILNDKFDLEYENVAWNIDAKPDEVTVIHTFAVNSNLIGNGIGKEIFNRIKTDALKNNQKSIRIDVIAGNVGAQKFFKKLGFKYVDTVEMFHEAVGLEKFHLYELVLEKK